MFGAFQAALLGASEVGVGLRVGKWEALGGAAGRLGKRSHLSWDPMWMCMWTGLLFDSPGSHRFLKVRLSWTEGQGPQWGSWHVCGPPRDWVLPGQGGGEPPGGSSWASFVLFRAGGDAVCCLASSPDLQ